MMIWHRVLWQLLLLTILTGVPSAAWAQSKTKEWTEKQCLEYMSYLLKIARDPSVDISEVTQHMGTRAGTEFAIFCRLREPLSRLDKHLSQAMAERSETAESEWRVNRHGKNMENVRNQSSAYDPGGLPGRTGPSNN